MPVVEIVTDSKEPFFADRGVAIPFKPSGPSSAKPSGEYSASSGSALPARDQPGSEALRCEGEGAVLGTAQTPAISIGDEPDETPWPPAMHRGGQSQPWRPRQW
jgi:hypothetical protein